MDCGFEECACLTCELGFLGTVWEHAECDLVWREQSVFIRSSQSRQHPGCGGINGHKRLSNLLIVPFTCSLHLTDIISCLCHLWWSSCTEDTAWRPQLSPLPLSPSPQWLPPSAGERTGSRCRTCEELRREKKQPMTRQHGETHWQHYSLNMQDMQFNWNLQIKITFQELKGRFLWRLSCF